MSTLSSNIVSNRSINSVPEVLVQPEVTYRELLGESQQM
jgi:hypothetical protein